MTDALALFAAAYFVLHIILLLINHTYYSGHSTATFSATACSAAACTVADIYVL